VVGDRHPRPTPNANNFTRTTAAEFPEGAAITTDDTIYFGFGFEGISTPQSRNAVMGRAMSHLLR
jgi:cytidine deaminase